jgi:hypothetical protein
MPVPLRIKLRNVTRGKTKQQTKITPMILMTAQPLQVEVNHGKAKHSAGCRD